MSSVAHTVRACVEEDPYLRFCMARGVISHAKLARWLQRERGVPGSEHAIISALRRMDMSDEVPPLDEGRRDIVRAKVSIRGKRVAIRVPKKPHALERVERLEEKLDELPRFVGDEFLTLVVPSIQLGMVEEILGEYFVDDVSEPCAMATVRLDEKGDAQAALSYVSDQLNQRGVKIRDSHTSPDLLRVLVPEEEFHTLRQILLEPKEGYD